MALTLSEPKAVGRVAPIDPEAVRRWVEATCAAQGVRVQIIDPAVLQQVVSLLGRTPPLRRTQPRKAKVDVGGWRLAEGDVSGWPEMVDDPSRWPEVRLAREERRALDRRGHGHGRPAKRPRGRGSRPRSHGAG